MSKKFEGEVAVISAGSAGMGLATAKRFVQEGMDHVFITGLREESTGWCGRQDWRECGCGTG